MSDKDDMWEAFAKIGELMAEREKELDDLAETCDYDMKLAVTRWVMKHIAEHGKEGGSYRYLIYERLGFGPEYHFHELKEVLNCCDEPGCYEVTSCGWPTEDGGYRHTCYEHMEKDK